MQLILTNVITLDFIRPHPQLLLPDDDLPNIPEVDPPLSPLDSAQRRRALAAAESNTIGERC